MDSGKLFRYAWYLALFTIFYNIAEGLVSVFFGIDDESFTLLGFGVDSFIEVLSGIGIAHMVIRIRNNPDSDRDRFENRALRITGISFYILTVGLILSGIYNVWSGHKPVTTVWGIIISFLSIAVMLLLVHEKRKTGIRLNSKAIIADAECTRVCIYMSVILLLSSLIYEVFKIPYIDSLGSFGLAYFSFNEGRECFEKIASNKNCSCENR